MTTLGIDPGVGHTGWAYIAPVKREIIHLGTIREREWEDVRDELSRITCQFSPVHVAVQVPAEPGKIAAFFRKRKDGTPIGPMALVKNAFLAGQIAGYCAGLGYEVIPVLPKRGRGMKMNAEVWARYWNWTGRCSEDARDAAAIALQGYMEAGR